MNWQALTPCYTSAMATVPDALHFAPEDYASPPRRLIFFGIDLFMIVLILIGIVFAAELVTIPNHVLTMPPSAERNKLTRQYTKPLQVPLPLGCLGLVAAYHVLVRTTRGGTLGYRLTGIRLIDKTGRTPGIKTAFKRFLIAIPSCMVLGAGFLLCFKTPRRQAIHDRRSETWLVRRRAEPVGPALSTYHTKLFGTFILTYTDIEPAPAA